MSRPVVEPPPSPFLMPDPRLAGPDSDVVAVGADLAPGTLLAAYRAGLFPMPIDPRRKRSKIAWYSPDPRGILPLDGLHVSRSLHRSRRDFESRTNTAFREVMLGCADPRREGRWITDAIIDAYCALHELGWGYSFETWLDGELVGGLYGLRIGRFFAGEAMFHTATDASKSALVDLVAWMHATDGALLDVQWSTPHLASLGVVDIGRDEYLSRLADALGSDG